MRYRARVDAEGQTGPPREAELSVRALGTGLAVGALLALANLYLGLTAGIWDSGSITASVLGFALAAALPSRGGRYGPLENNLTQTAAAAAGAMPAAAGLLGAVPAAALLGATLPAWAVLAWGAGLGVLGVLLALALRERLIVEEGLPFPTGTATAEVIRAMHRGPQEASSRARALLWAAGLAAAVTWLRDGRPALLPALLAAPGAILGLPAATLGLGLSLSPMMAGVGLVAGVPTGAGLLGGSLVAWAVLAPLAARAGWVAEATWPQLARWVGLPGVALLVGAAAVSLVEQAGTFVLAARDLSASRGGGAGAARAGSAWAWALAAAGAALVAFAGRALFGLHPALCAAALLLGVLLGGVCARAAGQTDISPLAQVGELTQAASGLFTAGAPLANVGAGGVVSGGAAQVGVTLWSLRAGHLLGAAPRRQAVAALAGAAVGVVVAVPAWGLLVRAYGLGSSRLPAPAALQFKALAELVSGGASALPRGAPAAVAVAASLGVLLALLGRRWRWIPNPVALGIGFLVPAHYAAAIFAGALAGEVLRRRSPEVAGRLAPVAGAGAIAGESVAGLLVALLVAAGWLAAG